MKNISQEKLIRSVLFVLVPGSLILALMGALLGIPILAYPIWITVGMAIGLSPTLFFIVFFIAPEQTFGKKLSDRFMLWIRFTMIATMICWSVVIVLYAGALAHPIGWRWVPITSSLLTALAVVIVGSIRWCHDYRQILIAGKPSV